MCSGQGSISVTSLPVRARWPPRYPPTAPAPTTAIRFPIFPFLPGIKRVNKMHRSGLERDAIRIEHMRRGKIDAQLPPLANLDRDVRTNAREDRLFDAGNAGGKDRLGAQRFDLNDFNLDFRLAGARHAGNLLR